MPNLHLTYHSPRLAPSGICTSIDKRAGTAPDTAAAPPAHTDANQASTAAGSRLATQLLRKQRAVEALKTIQRGMVGNDVDKLSELADASEKAAADYRARHPESADGDDPLQAAFTRYVDEHGDHFLMQLSVQGHPTLQSFLARMDDRPGRTDSVEKYAEDFLEKHDAGHVHTPASLCAEYASELQSATRTLREFLDSAVTLDGVIVAKGIKSDKDTDPRLDTAVDTRRYVQTFLAGDWTHHRGFLSTSASLNEAEDFIECPVDVEPLFAVAINDRSPEGLALKQMLHTRLSSGDFADLSVIHVFKCDGARGAVVEAVTGDYFLSTEREILLAPDHVSTPEQLVFCDNAVFLVSKVTHASLLSGEAARARFYRNEWNRQQETLQDEFRAWSNGEGSGEAFLAHLAGICMTSPAVRDYGGDGVRAGLLTEHRIEPGPGRPPFTVLFLKHPVHPGAGFMRKVPEGALENDRGMIIQEMIQTARDARNA